jgi:UDP-N-acetylglucosamine--N-acetylmuramyl-(pentapeptide) pyrophosphoryl-undecaprenol N-acetylglucosamine transferase
VTTVLIAGGGTGGHLMPALAIAEQLRRDQPEWRIVLAGAERGIEARLLPDRDWLHHLLPAEPIYRRQWWRNVRWPGLAWRLIRAVDRVLDLERPAVVVGTGGYAAGPVVWRAARRGIPTAVLEQDAFPGLTTRWLASRVREVYLAVPEARGQLNVGQGTEVIVTGAPILPPDPSLRVAGRDRFGLDPARPVVLVTGGSQGSLALNRVVAEWIRSGGTEGIQVLWATGRLTYDQFLDLHRPPAVQVFDFLDPIQPALAVADLAVTRAGMMTIAELCAWGIPGILVPLPTAAQDHQRRNAMVMAEAGAGVLLPQSGLTASRLGQEVGRLLQDDRLRAGMAEAALSRGRAGATVEIARRIRRLAAPS